MFSNKMVKSKLLFGALVVGLSSNSYALYSDPAPDPTWSNVTGLWIPYTYAGSVALDPEGGKSNDSSNGGASFSGDTDISSGWNQTTATCNPAGTGTRCGNKPSAYYYYWNNGTPNVITDDILYMRMRVNDDPRPNNGNNPGLNQSHWNFLIDIEQETSPGSGVYQLDGFKEIWLDINGSYSGSGHDTVRIVYDDQPSQLVANANGAGNSGSCPGGSGSTQSTPGGTVVNQFVACRSAGFTTDTLCNDGSTEFSHTRIVPIVMVRVNIM
ncbi:MAG: hypothetical protein KDI59_02635 [Xanthomonadales bacterium]|nr:hypothetical protein [Xanthomonadales bacterium]